MKLERNDNYRGTTYGALTYGQLFTIGNNVESVFMKTDEREDNEYQSGDTWSTCLASDQYDIGILKTFPDNEKVTVVKYKMVQL